MTIPDENEEICCAEFNPTLWDDKTFTWINKKFINDSICSLFYIPINFGKVMTRLDKEIRSHDAFIPDMMWLTEHSSPWKINVHAAVSKEIPNYKNTILTGTFYCKVYEGSFRDSKKWCEDFEKVAKSKGYSTKKLYKWCTTCPKCAKKFGKNYVAIFSQID